MTFSENLRNITDQTLVIRTGLIDALWDDGFEGDVVMALNLSTNEVTPLTFEDLTVPFYAEFWGAIGMVIEDFKENEFQVEFKDASEVVYSDYDEVENNELSNVLNNETVFQIFKEAVLMCRTL